MLTQGQKDARAWRTSGPRLVLYGMAWRVKDVGYVNERSGAYAPRGLQRILDSLWFQISTRQERQGVADDRSHYTAAMRAHPVLVALSVERPRLRPFRWERFYIHLEAARVFRRWLRFGAGPDREAWAALEAEGLVSPCLEVVETVAARYFTLDRGV